MVWEEGAREGSPYPDLGSRTEMKHVLFICSQNRLRSPTAEQVFARHPGIECIYMDPGLVRLLKAKVSGFLPAAKHEEP